MSPRDNKIDRMLTPPADQPLRWTRAQHDETEWSDWDLRERDESPWAFVVMMCVAAMLMVAGYMVARGFLG
jgi:hypothetical protein